MVVLEVIKKPIKVKAIQWIWRNWNEICEFVKIPDILYVPKSEERKDFPKLIIKTLEGEHVVNYGDYIIKGVEGEYYPIKKEIFEETYEIVDNNDKYNDNKNGENEDNILKILEEYIIKKGGNKLHIEMMKLFMDCLKLSIAKNSDYAGEEAPFKNFEFVEIQNLCKTEIGIMVRKMDKISRICNLLNGKERKVKDETIYDTIKDDINYSAILYVYMKLKNGVDNNGGNK